MNEIKDASPRELWKLSFPLMISFLSLVVMLFVDRLYLSWYSKDALTALVQAGTLAWGIILGWSTMAAMSEVFASQYNGSKQYKRIGIPVWQMIWLTLGSYLFYIPFALYGVGYIYDPAVRPLEYECLQMMMLFGPIFAMVPAISGFFIGRGQTKILQWMSLLGNGINIILDPIFIFGIDGFIPSMGITGAIIATGTGTLIQAVILLFIFLQKKHDEQYGSRNFRFNWTVFAKTCRVGLPPATFVMVEIFGWACFYHMMMMVSEVHIYVAGIVQSILMLFFFFGMGLEKGTIAVAGNMIGAKKPEKIKNLLFSGAKLIGIYALVTAIPMAIYPDPLIHWFMGNHEPLVAAITMAEVVTLIKYGLCISLFLLIFENMRWVVNGILTAAGDTFFLLIAGAGGIWGFLVLPTYFLIVVKKGSISFAFSIWIFYELMTLAILLLRYFQGKWKLMHLIDTPVKQQNESPVIQEVIQKVESNEPIKEPIE